MSKGEPADLPSKFSAGQVLVYRGPRKTHYVILVQRVHAPWTTWESLGNFWQWIAMWSSGNVDVLLENAMGYFEVS